MTPFEKALAEAKRLQVIQRQQAHAQRTALMASAAKR